MIPEDTFARHNELLRYVNQNLTVPPLKAICKTAGLVTQGRKNMLQMRIVGRLNELRATNRVHDYEILKRAILDQYAEHFATRPAWNSPSTATGMSAYAGTAGTGVRQHGSTLPNGTIAGTGGAEPMVFKSSPFFVLLAQLYHPCYCGAIPEHRSSFTMAFRFTQSQLDKMRDDSYRVYLLSALSEDAYRQATIQFPQSIEIRVNGKVVQANLRGIKNKPGTAKPADLTDYITKDAVTRNTIEVIYAYTRQRYTVTLHLARKRSVQDIVTRIIAGKRLAKETVIAQISKSHGDGDDDDIMATSSIVSLKCPLSFGRIQVPIRTIRCTHVQCFDATSYIQLQEQAPTWQCPVCNIYAPIEDIVVDNYFDEILKHTSKKVESIEIDPSGVWRVPEQNGVADDTDSEDEIGAGRNPEATQQHHGALEVIDSSPRRAGSRAPANVIDLTLSDDEESSRPAPRQVQPSTSTAVGPSNNGFHDAETGEDREGRRDSTGLSGLFTPSEHGPDDGYQTDQGFGDNPDDGVDEREGPFAMLTEVAVQGDADNFEVPDTSIIETPNRIESFINSIPDFSDYMPSPTPPPMDSEPQQAQGPGQEPGPEPEPAAQQSEQVLRPITPARSYPPDATSTSSHSLPAITASMGALIRDAQTAAAPTTPSPPPMRGYFSTPPRLPFPTVSMSGGLSPRYGPAMPGAMNTNGSSNGLNGTTTRLPNPLNALAPLDSQYAGSSVSEAPDEPPPKRQNIGHASSSASGAGGQFGIPEWAVMPSPTASTVVIEQSSDRMGQDDERR
ncbi:PINIT domain-containing protein [Lipomyces kononenkoae]|uniref:PINIT domain-containing protein n=1 Tax=Lipomyces kononenkoae TaxID=34357 RepID=A0ACC3SWH3_LIPKO